MNVDAAVTLVKQRLGNRVDSLDAQIVTEMVLAQTILEGSDFLPWFLLTEFSVNTTTANEERVPLPSNFLREYEEGSLYVYDSTQSDPWIELGKEDDETLRADTDLVGTTGQPKKYSVTGNYIRLKPTPDTTYTLRMLYYKYDTAPESGGAENQWLKYAPDWLIAQTVVQMARNLQMPQDKVANFEVDLGKGYRRVRVADSARGAANRNYVMGGADA